MEFPLYSSKGKKLSKKVTLEDGVFAAKINTPLMRTAVHVFLSNQRQATAHTKTRGEVRGGGAKPWKQKGTGRARHGSIRSPIWKGGGVVFGPRTERNYKRKLPNKMKKAALRSALSYFASDKRLVILESLDVDQNRLTKQVLGLTEKLPVEGKVLYIQKGNLKNLYLGSRNLKHINVITVHEVNVYTLLNHKFLVILQDALEDIYKFWGRTKEVKDHGKEKVVRKKVGAGAKEKKTLGDMGFSTRVVNALQKQGITTSAKLEEKVRKGEKIEGVGAKSMEEIKKVLKII